MIIDRMFQDSPTLAIEQVLKFTGARQKLLLNDVANISTPGYKQQDLSLDAFQRALAAQLDGPAESGASAGDAVAGAIDNPNEPAKYILFHDGNNRSAEQLMTDGMKNALIHNVMIELLRDQFATLQSALKDNVT
jgi:flagellar basal-body rod protein FlgB